MNNYSIVQKNSHIKQVKQSLYHLLLLVFGLILLFPFYWLISSSFKTNVEIFSREMVWIPENLRWENFAIGWKALPPYTYTLFFKNSFIIAGINVIGSILSNTLVAYGFARLSFKYKDQLFIVLLATMMLPYQVTMIPVYILFSNLHLVDSYVPLTLGSFFGSAFFIFLLRQFMMGIPFELDESAVCDGCSPFQIFHKIILPLCKPAIFTVILFSFSGSYDDFMGPLIYINSISKFPIPLALRMFVSNEGRMDWGPILAMTLVSLLPPLLVFLGAQKNLIEGISTTGLKG